MDFVIEVVLLHHVQLPILFSHSVRPHKLELLLGKLIELVLHLPHSRLLQLGDRLLGGQFLLAGLPQVGF